MLICLAAGKRRARERPIAMNSGLCPGWPQENGNEAIAKRFLVHFYENG